jgi:16S rRNA processing protein RimM
MSQSKKLSKSSLNSLEGSPTPGEPLYIPVGKFGRPFSYKGAVIFYPEAEYLEEIKPGIILFLSKKQPGLKIQTCRPHGKSMVMTLGGFTTETDAAKMTNQVAFMLADDLPLPQDRGYHRIQALGLEVFDENGKSLGFVEEIIQTGANDVYLVRGENNEEILLPAIESVIIKVDLDKKRMLVRPPEWE